MLILGLAAALLASGCGGSGGALTAKPTATPTPSAGATAAPSPTATATPKPAGPPPVPARSLRAARRLPLRERVAQLMVVGFEGTDLSSPLFAELEDHGWGGIIVGPANAADLAGVGVFAGEARVVSEEAKRVPPLVAAAADGRPAKLGSTRSRARRAAARSAAAAKAQGITLTTAPSVDVGLGADAEVIARNAPGAVRGWLAGGVAPAPSHFPGQGTVTQDPLDGPANVGGSAEALAGRDLRPFRAALRRAPAVTVSSATFTAYDPVTPAALTPAIVRGLLRTRLRFGGVAVSADISGLAVATGDSPQAAAVDAVRTGIDLLQVPDASQRKRVYAALLRAARSGRLPRGRVLDAVARVLALKRRVA